MIFYDNIADTTASSPGTSAFTLAGVVPTTPGFASFLSMVSRLSNGDAVTYIAVDSTDATVWGMFQGTYTTAGTSLSRDVVVRNSSGTTANVNFAHAVNIYHAPNATLFNLVLAMLATQAPGEDGDDAEQPWTIPGNDGDGIVSPYGDGSDGALTWDGSTTILGMAPSSNVYTLTRDVFATSFVVNNGVSIVCAGFRIFATQQLVNNGTIHANGNTASGLTQGIATGTGTLFGGAAGGAGKGTAANGGNGSASSPSAGGGTGGTAGSDGGSYVSGSAGTATQLTAAQGPVRHFPATLGMTIGRGTVAYKGGAGGAGAGCGDTSSISGGGGGGGGIVCIHARIVMNPGTISANGGNGASASGTGNAGSGGGGGGGVVIIVCKAFGGNAATATKGTKGAAKVGTGTLGNDGNDGTVYLINV